MSYVEGARSKRPSIVYRTEVFPMQTLPWTAPSDSPASDSTRDAVVMASRFRLQGLRDVPGFFMAALRIRKQMLASPGVLGVSLIARPLQKTFFTLSAWESREALNGAVVCEPHAQSMRRFRACMAESLFTFWEAPVTDVTHPGWPDAHQRLDEAAR